MIFYVRCERGLTEAELKEVGVFLFKDFAFYHFIIALKYSLFSLFTVNFNSNRFYSLYKMPR